MDGLPVRIPIIDITTVGAGGGSIAWLDEGGALRVGPESTGSEPGPACYDRGGTHPTVTDANLLSGLLDPGSFAVSEIRLNRHRARQAFQNLSAQAGLSDDETIVGVRSVVNANMLRGIRKATVEKGIDTRQCSLLAFGGAGPLHAAELAEALGIKEVIIPPMAGMFSALGILLAKARLLFGQSLLVPLDDSAANVVSTVLDAWTLSSVRVWNVKRRFFIPP
jgi:N-methylhydantoinase A